MTDWENRYQTGDMPWEKGQPSPPLLELLGKPVDWGKGPILVPGCGFGHDVRALGVLGVPVVRPRQTETTALGAAYLAGLATGIYADTQAIAREIWKSVRADEMPALIEKILVVYLRDRKSVV